MFVEKHELKGSILLFQWNELIKDLRVIKAYKQKISSIYISTNNCYQIHVFIMKCKLA